MSTTKRILWSSAVVMVGIISIGATEARPRTGGMQPERELIVNDQGRFLRGWASFSGTTMNFRDVEGNSYTFDRTTARVFAVQELESQFEEQLRDVNRKGDQTEEYVKLLPIGMNQQLYEKVANLAEKLIRRNPANPRPQAIDAQRWAQDKLRLMQEHRRPKAAGLSEEDIQKMRFALIPINIPLGPMRIRFGNNVTERFLAQVVESGQFIPADKQKFKLALPGEQLQMIKDRTRNQYQQDIAIEDDPPLVKEFRRTVLPVVTRSCATADCHGGDAKPKLYPVKLGGSEPGPVYTDLYIMEAYPAKSGRIIDHANPANSLIATYSLPARAEEPSSAHSPAIPPVFRSDKDRKYAEIVAWLQTMPAQMPEYGIKPPPELNFSSTAPAVTAPNVGKLISPKEKQ